MACGYFKNGDGLLVLQVSSERGLRSAPQRLYHTDSGHYLLPINNFGKKLEPAAKRAGTELRKRIKENFKPTTKTVADHAQLLSSTDSKVPYYNEESSNHLGTYVVSQVINDEESHADPRVFH